jgi:outer membrane protein OmpA-like peptidoglycan-associated protein
MFRQRRPLLRAAVVGGSAYAAGRRSAQRQAEQAQLEDDQNERLAGLEQQQQPPPQQPGPQQPAAGPDSSVIDQLGRLSDLHQQGALTDSEFAAAKAKILGS